MLGKHNAPSPRASNDLGLKALVLPTLHGVFNHRDTNSALCCRIQKKVHCPFHNGDFTAYRNALARGRSSPYRRACTQIGLCTGSFAGLNLALAEPCVRPPTPAASDSRHDVDRVDGSARGDGGVLAVALPSFTALMQSNRVASEVSAFVGSLQFARAEAIKQGLPVTVCASSNGADCLNLATWNTGWIVFTDLDTSKTRESGEAALKIQPPWTSTDTFSAGGNLAAITYSRDGFALSLTGTALFTLRTNPVNASATRCVAINLAGRQQVLRVPEGGCE